jgi:hypothetical protein
MLSTCAIDDRIRVCPVKWRSLSIGTSVVRGRRWLKMYRPPPECKENVWDEQQSAYLVERSSIADCHYDVGCHVGATPGICRKRQQVASLLAIPSISRLKPSISDCQCFHSCQKRSNKRRMRPVRFSSASTPGSASDRGWPTTAAARIDGRRSGFGSTEAPPWKLAG